MVTLENIEHHIIPFDQFELKWRFTEEKYNFLPVHHLKQIRPLDKAASKMLDDLTNTIFDAGFLMDPVQFKRIEAIHVPDSIESEPVIKKWLSQRGLPLEREVFVSWHQNYAALTNWKMIVRYWSDFWYPISDDLVIMDETSSWALVFYHWGYVQFGTNRLRQYEPSGDNA